MLGLKRLRLLNIKYRIKREWENLLSGTFSEILPDYIKDSSKTPQQYSVSLSFRRNTSWNNGIYWDTLFGIELRSRGQPIACIGFDLNPNPFQSIRKPRVITVRQLQGVKGQQDSLKGIRWERLLLRTALQISRALNYEQLEVRGGKINNWTDKVRPEVLKLRYDVTALREGLSLDDQRGIYYVNLTPQ